MGNGLPLMEPRVVLHRRCQPRRRRNRNARTFTGGSTTAHRPVDRKTRAGYFVLLGQAKVVDPPADGRCVAATPACRYMRLAADSTTSFRSAVRSVAGPTVGARMSDLPNGSPSLWFERHGSDRCARGLTFGHADARLDGAAAGSSRAVRLDEPVVLPRHNHPTGSHSAATVIPRSGETNRHLPPSSAIMPIWAGWTWDDTVVMSGCSVRGRARVEGCAGSWPRYGRRCPA
jgi:hypothetical protein